MRGNRPLMKLRSTLAPFAMLATLMVPGITEARGAAPMAAFEASASDSGQGNYQAYYCNPC